MPDDVNNTQRVSTTASGKRGELDGAAALVLASVVSWEKKGMVMLKVKVCFVAFVLTAHVFGEVTGSTENAYACDR